jgi:hypothetical protein
MEFVLIDSKIAIKINDKYATLRKTSAINPVYTNTGVLTSACTYELVSENPESNAFCSLCDCMFTKIYSRIIYLDMDTIVHTKERILLGSMFYINSNEANATIRSVYGKLKITDPSLVKIFLDKK